MAACDALLRPDGAQYEGCWLEAHTSLVSGGVCLKIRYTHIEHVYIYIHIHVHAHMYINDKCIHVYAYYVVCSFMCNCIICVCCYVYIYRALQLVASLIGKVMMNH